MTPQPADNAPAAQEARIEPAAPPAAPASDPVAAVSDAGVAAVWDENAVECPRDWVAGQDGEIPPGCEGSTVQAVRAATTVEDRSALEEAAVERASEEAGLDFAARVPAPRPEYEPPAPRKRVVTRAGAKRPAGPPPKCGAGKRAKWRYVNKVPTWYCK